MCIAKFIHLYCQGTANESIFKNKIVVKILSSISKMDFNWANIKNLDFALVFTALQTS